MDNSEYNDYNTDRISYGLANVAENVILRYTLKDYAAWKGQLNVYYGDRDIYKSKSRDKGRDRYRWLFRRAGEPRSKSLMGHI